MYREVFPVEEAAVLPQPQPQAQPKRKRVSAVEFWRFVFTVMVSLYHMEIFFMKKTLFPSGSGAVEFFFVLAGFTLAMSAERRHLARMAHAGLEDAGVITAVGDENQSEAKMAEIREFAKNQ